MLPRRPHDAASSSVLLRAERPGRLKSLCYAETSAAPLPLEAGTVEEEMRAAAANPKVSPTIDYITFSFVLFF